MLGYRSKTTRSPQDNTTKTEKSNEKPQNNTNDISLPAIKPVSDLQSQQTPRTKPEGEDVQQQPAIVSTPRTETKAKNDTPPYICGGCNNVLVRGQVYKALSTRWHPQCFLCGACGKPIILPGRYGSKSGNPFHAECLLGNTNVNVGDPV